MSRATARSDRFAPSVSRWRRATVLISSIISARTRARIECCRHSKRLLHTSESTALASARRHVADSCLQERAAALEAESRTQSALQETRGEDMSEHVIVGAGAVGSATALLLAERGEHVRVISRRGTGPEHPAIERVAADATDAERLTELASGAAALYNCASPPVPPVVHRLAAAGRGAADRGRAQRRCAGHHEQPVRLRTRSTGRSPRRRRSQPPTPSSRLRARDVAGRARRARGRPHPRDRGPRQRLHRAELAAVDGDRQAAAEGLARVFALAAGRAAQLDLDRRLRQGA